ncbi:MAG TPA: Rieske (2Fe-2S) protein [Myxococcales bacterium]|jgi:Rieske Fe-S protein
MSSDESGKGPADPGRRRALKVLGVGVVGAAVAAPLVVAARSLVPNVLYEPPRRFKAGRLEALTEGPNFFREQRVFVFREAGKLSCLSAVCTHLGCTVQLVRKGSGDGFEFHCPCHGSKYRADGTNYDGPAPRPLSYHLLEIAPDDGQVVVDLSRTADKTWRLKV